MAITPNMGLDKPTPSVDAGPAWATRLNADLDLLDAHDHSAGKGTKVTPAGLNINSDVNATNAARLRGVGGLTMVNGGTTENLQLRTNGTDLFWQDSSANLMALTANGRPNAKFIGSVNGLFLLPTGVPVVISSVTTLSSLGNEILILYDTSGGIFTLTLPSIAGVGSGRVYYLHERAGSANALTVARNGTDKINNAAANLTLNTANKGTVLISDASSNSWWVFP